MNKIRLTKVDEMKDGTTRLQSQLYVGRDSCDFIIKEGVLMCWGTGERGFDFYAYNAPYEIVESKNDNNNC